jgi:hypothetical protein
MAESPSIQRFQTTLPESQTLLIPRIECPDNHSQPPILIIPVKGRHARIRFEPLMHNISLSDIIPFCNAPGALIHRHYFKVQDTLQSHYISVSTPYGDTQFVYAPYILGIVIHYAPELFEGLHIFLLLDPKPLPPDDGDDNSSPPQSRSYHTLHSPSNPLTPLLTSVRREADWRGAKIRTALLATYTAVNAVDILKSHGLRTVEEQQTWLQAWSAEIPWVDGFSPPVSKNPYRINQLDWCLHKIYIFRKDTQYIFGFHPSFAIYNRLITPSLYHKLG